MGRRSPPLRPLTTLVLASLLAGCSGTPLGEGLSRSFPGPGGPSASETAAASGPPDTAAAAGTAEAASADAAPPGGATAAKPAQKESGAKPPDKPPAKKPAGPQADAAQPPRSAAATVPYRLVLRLPLADPAAPAEVVTDALRAAGVSFEVETIERLSAGPGDGQAGAKPAEADGSGEAAGAQTRPAPEPR